MQIETIGASKTLATKKPPKEPEVREEALPPLLPSGAEIPKMRALHLNLADVTRPMNKDELDSFMISTVRRLLKTGRFAARFVPITTIQMYAILTFSCNNNS